MAADLKQRLPKTVEIIETGIRQRLHHGVQIYVSLDGETIVNNVFGENQPGEPLTPDTLTLWLSSGKPLTAFAVLQLVDRGELSLEQTVASVIPEFGQKEKDTVTISHLLTHTAGIRPVSTGWPQKPWGETIQKICDASLRMNWIPGERAGYDPARSWFILGEIVRRTDGRPIEQYIRDEIFTPLGMTETWMAMPKAVHRDYGTRIGKMYNLKDGELQASQYHQAEVCASPSPGGSMRGPISELGKFYEMLMRGGVTEGGQTLLSSKFLEQMTSRQREDMHDETFQHKLDFGLGLIINSNRYGAETVPYGFGRYASDEAFGHGGAQSSIGFADPKHQLVVAAVANGCPGEVLHNQRFRELNSAIFEDLELLP